MEFKLSTSRTYYDNEQREKLEKLGFSFVEVTFEDWVHPLDRDENWTIDESVPGPTIEICSLGELMKFEYDWGLLLWARTGCKFMMVL